MDQGEFIELINAHKGTIHHLLNLYISNDDEKEDLKQEIILEAWKGKDKFQGRSSFHTWLYKVSLYTILTYNRKNRKLTRVEMEEVSLHHDPDTTPLDNAEKLRRCISALEPLSKAIITMHLDGFSNKEISEFMGITTNHINVKIFRIKESIKKTIEQEVNGAE